MQLLKRLGLWLAGERRSSDENPAYPVTDRDAVIELFGGMKSSAGVRVNSKTSLSYSPVWRAVNLISRDVAKLPLFIYRRTDEGKERAQDHPAYSLLRWKPNAHMTCFTFRQTMMRDALLEGNGLAYIARRGDAVVEQIVPLPPGVSYPLKENGVLWYYTQTPNGETRKLRPRDVLHIKGLGYDGLSGYKVWELAKDSFGTGMAAQQFGARYFSNGAEPSVVLEHPETLGDDALKNLRNSWNQAHQGLERSHLAAILEEGMKVSKFGNTAREAQLLELRQFEVREVANWFGVPPHKLGDTTRTAFASLEQENQSYLDDALDGWLVNWEEECREKLLSDEEKENDTHFVEFERKALVRADLTARANYYRQALGGMPWHTINEVRRVENLNDIEGGDELIIPSNIGPKAEPDPPPSQQPDPAEPQDTEDDEEEEQDRATRAATRSVLLESLTRAAGKLAGAARRRKAGAAIVWTESITNAVRDTIETGLTAYGAARGLEFKLADVCGRILSNATDDLSGDLPIDEFERSMPAAVLSILESEYGTPIPAR